MRVPLSNTTRVSSGWRASINNRFVIMVSFSGQARIFAVIYGRILRARQVQ
jgi:hypothetical protein